MPTMTHFNLPSGAHLVCLAGDINGIPVDPCHTCPDCDKEPMSISSVVTMLGEKPDPSLLLVCAESDDSAAPIPRGQPNLSSAKVAVILVTPRDKQRVIRLLHEKHPLVALEQLRAESGAPTGAPRVMVRPRFMRYDP